MKKVNFPDWTSPLAAKVEELFFKLPTIDITIPANNDSIKDIRINLQKAQETVSELRQIIEPHHFGSEKEEIEFFRLVKPLFLSSLFYWRRLFQLTLHQPMGGRRIIRRYWKNQLLLLASFYQQNSGFYEYIRINDHHLDTVYFLRANQNLKDDVLFENIDPHFTSPKDNLLSKILANDALEDYIRHLLREAQESPPSSNLRWTASKASAVELIYALQSGGVYNHGQSEIKEIAETFQQLFQVDLGNYYHVFNELRLRKKNRTSLLDQLREKVIKKMDELDEK